MDEKDQDPLYGGRTNTDESGEKLNGIFTNLKDNSEMSKSVSRTLFL